MDIDEILKDVVTEVSNSTQSSDALQSALATPDYAHIKAAAVVILCMVLRDFSRSVIPRVLTYLKTQYASAVEAPKQE
jgi:hypothetical protein